MFNMNTFISPRQWSSRQWLFVMAMVSVGFMALLLPITWPGGALGALMPAVLMPGIPLLAFAYVTKGHWTAIVGMVGFREVRLMLGFTLLNIVVIGSARLVLTLPRIMTKHICVSTGAHIINDWLLFGVGLLGAGMASHA